MTLVSDLTPNLRRRAERDAGCEINTLRDPVASAQAEAQSHKAQLENARQQAAAAAREQFELELKASKQALDEKESALTHLSTGELALRRQLRERAFGRSGRCSCRACRRWNQLPRYRFSVADDPMHEESVR